METQELLEEMAVFMTAVSEQIQGMAVDLAEVKAQVATLYEEFHRYSPILEAYLRPDAAGPLAWAVRRRQAKASTNGNL